MDFGSILLAALGIGLLIFLHEAGHFLAARLAGVRVEVFSLGFGSRLAGFTWRGTDFRLSLVPFGGYVMVAGQDPGDRRYPARESLWAKTVGQRALFWSGGVLMNLAFALVVFPLVFRLGVDFQAPVVGRAIRGGAAWEAGLQAGERIVAIGGKQLYSFENLVVEAALTGGRPVALRVRGTDGNERTVTVEAHWNAADGRYELGIEPAAKPVPPTLAVTAGGPAAKAGLRQGDLLLAIDGRRTTGAPDDPALDPLVADAPLTAVVRRGHEEISAQVAPIPAPEPTPYRIGVQLLQRQVAGIQRGVAFVDDFGLRRGDVVLAIDGRPFLGGELRGADAAAERLRIQVRRGEQMLMFDHAATPDQRDALATRVALTGDTRALLVPLANQAAEAAGLLPGDAITSVDGTAIDAFDDLRQVVERSTGKPLVVVVQRLDPRRSDFLDPRTGDLQLPLRAELTIVPRRAAQPDFGLHPELTPLTEQVRAESFVEALRLGCALSLDMIKQLYVTMKRMVTGDVGAKNLGGIIRISQVSYQAAQRGSSWFLYLLAMLSLNLAFVNLLPIPVLDGGHMMFLLIEKVKGSPVSTRVFGYSQVLGLVFVLMLVLFVTYNDILQLL